MFDLGLEIRQPRGGIKHRNGSWALPKNHTLKIWATQAKLRAPLGAIAESGFELRSLVAPRQRSLDFNRDTLTSVGS
jgi:hypothetical protein